MCNMCDIEHLNDENAPNSLARDAARYRWLRQLKGAQEAVGESSPEGVDLLVDEEIRAEQDAGD